MWGHSFLPFVFGLVLFVLFPKEGHLQRIDERIKSRAQILFEEAWDWKLSAAPESATMLGIHDYDDQLSDTSEAGYLKRRNQMLEFISRSKKIREDPTTSESDKFNLRVLDQIYQRNSDRIANQSYHFQISKVYGMHRWIDKVFKRMPLKTVNDYEVMLKRLEKVPAKIDQIIGLMRDGSAKGYAYHQLSIGDFNSSLTNYLVDDPKNSTLYKVFANYAQNLDQQTKKDLDERCITTIREKITPAFHKLGHFMTVEYKTRQDTSVSSIPNGSQYYQHCIRHYTSTDLSPKEIHDIGLKEVVRIEQEIKEIMVSLGHGNLTIKQFSDLIREDPKNYLNNSDEVKAEFERLCNDVIPPKLPSLFKTINKASSLFSIQGDEFSTSAYYIKGNLDGTKPGTFFFPTFNNRPKYSFPTLAVHEVSPGHHFHFSYLGNFDMPLIRKAESQTFFSEGWALYAEKLGIQMGLYEDPLDKIGHLNAELFRACRLVVDTGLHALNWTPKMAIDFMFERVAKLYETIEREIYRYLTNPGQALAYKIGELKIMELRRKAEKSLLEKFDIKEFHEIVLSSHGGSMGLVEERVNAWIEQMGSQRP